jgi:hypothetical protein
MQLDEPGMEQLGGPDQAEAADQQAPFHGSALQGAGGGDGEHGEEEMDAEARMAAHAELDAAKGMAKSLAPGT